MINEFISLVTNPSILQVLAWSFVIAAFVGAVLDDHGKDLIKWSVAVGTFAILNGFGSVAVMNHGSLTIVTTVVTFTFLFLINYCLGLTIGWYITGLARSRAIKIVEKKKALDLGISITQVRRNEKVRDKYISSKTDSTGDSTSHTITTTTTTTTKENESSKPIDKS